MTRKAVLVGLNAYPNPRNRLRGCLNDVRQVRNLLQRHFGFDEVADLQVLTDSRATTSAIRERLSWLVAGARAGDVLVFHYSGHGSQVPDVHGDEPGDGLDEIICPYDLDWDDPFTDDDLHEIFGNVPSGVNLTVLLDCCHSGTGLKEFEDRTRANGTLLISVARCICPPPVYAGARRLERRVRRFARRAVESGATLIAACRDDQVSADAYIEGEYHGAFTFYLCEALAECGFSATYRDAVAATRRLLRQNGFDQEPQLETLPRLAQSEMFAPVLLPA